MTPEQYLAVAEEVVDKAEALSAGERWFVLAHTDVTEAELSEGGRVIARVVAYLEQGRADAEIAERSLTTKQVAALMGRGESNVRRSRRDGLLYALEVDAGRRLRFPLWQFSDDGHALPGLREILAALPECTHPLTVERFMTTATDALDDRSPRDWLTSGGQAEPVVALAHELGYS